MDFILITKSKNGIQLNCNPHVSFPGKKRERNKQEQKKNKTTLAQVIYLGFDLDFDLI